MSGPPEWAVKQLNDRASFRIRAKIVHQVVLQAKHAGPAQGERGRSKLGQADIPKRIMRTSRSPVSRLLAGTRCALLWRLFLPAASAMTQEWRHRCWMTGFAMTSGKPVRSWPPYLPRT